MMGLKAAVLKDFKASKAIKDAQHVRAKETLFFQVHRGFGKGMDYPLIYLYLTAGIRETWYVFLLSINSPSIWVTVLSPVYPILVRGVLN